MLHQIVLRDAAISQWITFTDPVDVFVAQRPADVLPVIRAAERRVRNEGLYVAGFVTYEAGPGFDGALTTHNGGKLPLVCLGLFAEGIITDHLEPDNAGVPGTTNWKIAESQDDYFKKIHYIKRQIEAGNTYQINYTVRQHADEIEDPWALFQTVAIDAPYAAYVECDDHIIVSASPELFFRRQQSQLICKPMKGTSKRGLTAEADILQRDTLLQSIKNRAENVMILDMVRNDLGRIAQPGSVEVTDLYELEKYPTVWQMTSTVAATSNASIAEIFAALFPSASVTGAPKVSSMKLINELEDTRREIYTGAIGYFGPDNRAQFNVAIRTALVDKNTKTAVYGVGGGIVWDSDPRGEYEECLAKARVLLTQRAARNFELLETMLWTPNLGFVLLREHLDRLGASADYFDFSIERDNIENALIQRARRCPAQRQRFRLTVRHNGDFLITQSALEGHGSGQPQRIFLAGDPVNADNVFLYHKTTHREVYDNALAASPNADDVLLWNEDGYITETCVANVAVRIDGELFTPPVSCGLLGGTYRHWLLQNGMIEERLIHVDELLDGSKLTLLNSVRTQYSGMLQLHTETTEATAARAHNFGA